MDGTQWRPPWTRVGCSRLKNAGATEHWKAASAQQVPPTMLALYDNAWISFLRSASHEGDDPEATEGATARTGADRISVASPCRALGEGIHAAMDESLTATVYLCNLRSPFPGPLLCRRT